MLTSSRFQHLPGEAARDRAERHQTLRSGAPSRTHWRIGTTGPSEARGRAGDFDASGEDMVRDIDLRTSSVFGPRIVRVALTEDQVDDLDLPIDVGKEEDPRAEDFRARHGGLWQVELDALFGIAPDIMRDMFAASLESYWNPDAYFDLLGEEDIDRSELEEEAS